MKKQLIVASLLVLILVCLTPFTLAQGGAAAPLTDLTVTLLNGGAAVADGEQLDPTLDTRLRLDFGIPVDGSVKAGDWLEITLPEALRFTTETAIPIYLDADGLGEQLQIGVLEINGKSDARLTFNEEVENAQDVYLEMGGYFIIGIDFEQTVIEESREDIVLRLFDKEFVLPAQPAPEPVHIGLAKTGTVDLTQGVINWLLTATPEQTALLYDGYTFRDALPAGVTYVADSFTVNGQAPETGFACSDGILTYTFAPGTSGVQTIRFQTAIQDLALLNNKAQTITNTATLSCADSGDRAEASGTVKFTPDWLKKGGSYQVSNHSVNWTITANSSRALLKNAVIRDTLDAALTLTPGSLKLNGQVLSEDAASTPYYTYDPVTRQLCVYLGQIDSKQTVTFNGQLDSAVRQSVTNNATLSWDDEGSSIGSGMVSGGATVAVNGSGSANVTQGFIQKAAGTYDYTNNVLPWTIRVDQAGQPVADAKVVEIFVYHNDESSKSNKSGKFPSLTGYEQYRGLSMTTDQKYLDGSLTINNGAATQGDQAGQYTLETVALSQNVTAQILTIYLGDLTDLQTICLHTKLTNQEAYGSNGGNSLYKATNYATLLSRDSEPLTGNATAQIFHHILEKDVAVAYNYADRTVTWQLHLNHNKLTIENGQLVDTLPAYFAPDGEAFYEIYHGSTVTTGGNPKIAKGALLTAEELSQILQKVEVTAVSEQVQQLTFTFNTINDSYVILIKTKLSEADAARLFMGSNENITLRNQAYATGSTICGKQGDYEDITIANRAVTKTGVLEQREGYYTGNVVWTMDVNSNGVDITTLDGVETATVVDPLAEYLEPVYRNGAYALRVWELQVQANGSLQLGQELEQALVQGNLTWENHTLRFTLPQKDRAYRLQLTTAIVSDTVTAIKNTAYLEGFKQELISTPSTIRIEYAEGGAWAKLAGKITLTKQDEENGKTLSGAVFQLYQIVTDENGQEQRVLKYTKITDAKGKVEFSRLPSGNYIVIEQTPPVGYSLNPNNAYPLTINTDDAAQRKLTQTITNPVLTRAIQILKTDEQGVVLAQAQFGLYQGSISPEKLLATATSDANGAVTFANLKPGIYYIAEIAAPAGYQMPEQQQVVKAVINQLGQTSYWLDGEPCNQGLPKLANTANRVNIAITKTNTNGRLLSGARFTLYDQEGNQLSAATTGPDGVARFNNLTIGSYTIRETRAPSGYKLSRTPLTITEADFAQDGKLLEYQVINHRETIDRPDPDSDPDPDPTPDPDPIPDPEEPIPGPAPDPPVEILEPDTPLGDLPGGSTETVDIPETQTPTGSKPQQSSNSSKGDTIDILDEEVPLGAVPKTGDPLPAVLIGLALAAAGLTIFLRKAKQDAQKK